MADWLKGLFTPTAPRGLTGHPANIRKELNSIVNSPFGPPKKGIVPNAPKNIRAAANVSASAAFALSRAAQAAKNREARASNIIKSQAILANALEEGRAPKGPNGPNGQKGGLRKSRKHNKKSSKAKSRGRGRR